LASLLDEIPHERLQKTKGEQLTAGVKGGYNEFLRVAKEELQKLIDTNGTPPLIENIKHAFGIVFSLMDRNYAPSDA
jgi:hypothetical protein